MRIIGLPTLSLGSTPHTPRRRRCPGSVRAEKYLRRATVEASSPRRPLPPTSLRARTSAGETVPSVTRRESRPLGLQGFLSCRPMEHPRGAASPHGFVYANVRDVLFGRVGAGPALGRRVAGGKPTRRPPQRRS